MEHLRLPRGAVLTEIDLVPYVADEDYLGVPFLSYPIQKGFSHALRGQSEFRIYNTLHPTPVADLERFLQTWLFFGLLQEVLGPFYRHEDFVRVVHDSSGERQVLTTSKLLSLVDQWLPSATEKARSSDPWCDHLAKCLDIVSDSFLVQDPPFNPRISFSIATTGEIIAGAATHLFKVDSRNRFVHAWTVNLSKSPQIQQMYANGWCKNEAHVSSTKFRSTETLHFMSKMLKNDAYRSHQACQPQQCIAGHVDLAKYQPKHCDENCNCTLISVDEEKLNNILEYGSLPLLRFGEDAVYNDGYIELVVSTPGSSYIAISHVWADGLGNPHNNALPRCQILRLQRLLDKVKDGGDQDAGQSTGSLYWLDTLCCPSASGPGKTTTLGMMKQIYENASHVLVLDLSLQAYNLEDMCMLEACVRVFTSPWLRRLWTLQEGAFAKKLLIQFCDRHITVEEIFASLRDTFRSEGCQDKELVHDLVPQYSAFSNYVGDNANVDLRRVSKALRFRSVSVPADEALCLANLLGLNENLAKLKTGRMERMWQLLSLSRRLPSRIVFFDGPKIRQKGYRWAPSTLLGLEFQLESYMSKGLSESATVNPHGLVVQFAGVLLSVPKPVSPNLRNSREAQQARSLHIRHVHSGRWWFLSYPPFTNPIYTERLEQPSLYLSLRESLVPHAFILSPLETKSDIRSDGGRQGLFARLSDIVDGIYHVQSRVCAVLKEHTTAYQEVLSVADNIARELQQNAVTEVVRLTRQLESGNESESLLSVASNLKIKMQDAARTAFENHPGLKKNLEEISRAGTAEGYLLDLITDLYTNRYALIDEVLPETTRWCVD